MSPTVSNRSGPLPLFFTRVWFYFLIFTAVNAVLAYAPFSLKIKLWIGLVGFLLPFVLGIRALSSQVGKENTLLDLELFKNIPSRVWWLVIGLGIIIRLAPLLSSSWIFPDEGLFCQISVELYKKWEWLFFFSDAQVPPLYNWALALYYHLISPSVFTTRLFIFLLGILALALSFLASRLFFSKSASLLYVIFFALGLWPLFFCRFCLAMPVCLLFQMVVFFLLGLFAGASSPKKSMMVGLALGLTAGIGFWTAIPWLLMIPMLALAVIPMLAKKPVSVSFGMMGGFVFFLLLFLFMSLTENGEHVKYLWVFYRQAELADSLKNLFSNWTLLFWEGNPRNEYGPVWGGFLNPMEGAFCFLGIMTFIRFRRLAFSRWILASAVVFVIPGLLTNGYESFHNVLLLPILLVFCACGAQHLLVSIPASWRPIGISIIVLTSAMLNFVHLDKTFAALTSEYSSLHPEYSQVRRIFSMLDRTRRQDGPGLVFWELSSFRQNALEFETYPFNAADNPRISVSDVHWAAFLCNSNYKFFLKSRFPDSKWYWIGPDHYWNEGGLSLAVIPFQSLDRAGLGGWLEANSRLHAITRERLFDHNDIRADEIRRELMGMESLLENDPFWENVFWERVIAESGQGQPPSQWISWIDRAINKGYPAAHLFVAKGMLLKTMGKQREAREAFNQAVHSPLNLTNASEYLRSLDALKQKSRP